MQGILDILNWVLASGPNLLAAIMAVLVALIVLFSLIPGDQPDKALQAVVDFLGKFSIKKKE